MHSPSSADSGPSTMPAAMRGGGMLARVLATGWRIAPRVWPWALLAGVPGLLALLFLPTQSVRWPSYLFELAARTLIATALLPSILRWFADEREPIAMRWGDARGRVVQALGAVAVMGTGLLPGMLISSETWHSMVRDGRWGLVAVLVGSALVCWIHLRLTLICPAAIVERAPPWLAVRRSWRLTRGRLPVIFGIGLLFGCASALPGMVVAEAFSGGDFHSPATLWTSAVVAALVQPLWLAFWAVLYHDARADVDGISSRRIAEDAAPV